MKLNLKYLAAVAALAVSAPSFATISTDSWNGSGGALTGNGTGELFLVAYDAARAQTFIVDLNLTANTFINNNASLINAFSVTSSAFQTWIAGGTAANIQWNMGGISNTSSTYGVLTTHGVGAAGAGAAISGSEIPPDGTALITNANNTNFFLDGVNATIGAGNTTIGTGNGTWTAGNWGATIGGGLTWNNSSTGFGNQMLMSFIHADENDYEAVPLVQGFAGLWGVNAATGQISYVSAGGPAVPIPAAIWLLGSSLLGLTGIARRRRA